MVTGRGTRLNMLESVSRWRGTSELNVRQINTTTSTTIDDVARYR